MKKPLVLAVCVFASFFALIFVFVTPVKSIESVAKGCNHGQNFHILLGQYSDYYGKVIQDREDYDPLWDGVCTGKNNDKINLFL